MCNPRLSSIAHFERLVSRLNQDASDMPPKPHVSFENESSTPECLQGGARYKAPREAAMHALEEPSVARNAQEDGQPRGE